MKEGGEKKMYLVKPIGKKGKEKEERRAILTSFQFHIDEGEERKGGDGG